MLKIQQELHMCADQFQCQARMGRIGKLQTRGLSRLGILPYARFVGLGGSQSL